MVHPDQGGYGAGAPLYTPWPERVVTTNAWAFLHWLRLTKGVTLADWSALQRFSAMEPAQFAAIIAQFAQLPDGCTKLARHRGTQEALVCCGSDGTRHAIIRDRLRSDAAPELPPEMASLLVRDWPASLLVGPLAELLLHADLRPDDRLLIAGSPVWPWLAALLAGTTLILADPSPNTLLATVGKEQASVLVAPSVVIAEAVFGSGNHQPLGPLRMIIATDGPAPPETLKRIAVMAPDAMVLARSDDTLWGTPLEPVFAPMRSVTALLVPRGPQKNA